MAGCVRGFTARIQSEYPLALSSHCFSHKLNLVIVDAYQVQTVWNAVGVISKVALFSSNSPKWQAALEVKITETEQTNKKQHLLDLCRTRWIDGHEAFENFSQFYEVAVQVLEDTCHSQARIMTQSLMQQLCCLVSLCLSFDQFSCCMEGFSTGETFEHQFTV